MRQQVEELVAVGRMPADLEAASDLVARYEAAINALPDSATDEEAVALLNLLPADDGSLFGLAWSVVHFVETSPGWPIEKALLDPSWWIQVLRGRASSNTG